MTYYTPLQLLPPLPPGRDFKPARPTALTVDPFSDILWVGSSNGIVSSFCSPLSLTRNVQFPAHGGSPSNSTIGGHPNDQYQIIDGKRVNGVQNVKEIRVTDRDIWTLTEGGIGGRRRGGAAKWSVSDPTRSLRTMSPNPINSHEVLAGGTGQTLIINTSRGDVVRKLDNSPLVHLIPLHRSVLAASLSGRVSILDPRTGFNPTMAPVQAHTGGISGADAQGNLICTWGWTHKQGHPVPDPLLRLYDIRTLRALPPVTFNSGPAFALINPGDPTKLMISSQQGILQITDLATNTSDFQQLDVSSFITSMSLSPAGDYLIFGDGNGQVHLWSTHEGQYPPFNGYDGIKPEWPDAEEPPVHMEENAPLNLVGMPYYNEPLLSNFPTRDYAPPSSPFFHPPDPIPHSVLSTMRMVDFVGYASMPKELRGKRNIVSHAGLAPSRRESEPRFRSEVAKAKKAEEAEEVVDDGAIPKYYRKVEIKYSKFGVEDFDFGYYNHTEYSGLETHILNSYTNALLQALHYTPISAVAKAHICVDCKKEHCLLCEAGFLFRMLEDAKGTNCQASNFSRAFSATSQASALGLMEDEQSSYGSLIQSFNRWLLSCFSAESVVEGDTFKMRPTELSAIDQVVGLETRSTNSCTQCGYTTSRETTIQVLDLTYPKKFSTFTELLQSSIVRETSTKASCTSCRNFTYLHSKRELVSMDSLPPVLCINAMTSEGVWGKKRSEPLLPVRIGFGVEGGELVISEDKGVLYNLKSLVVQVDDGTPHLISFVKMPDEWIMFNDFLVRPVSQEEVLSFTEWKTPAIIIFERESPLDLSALPTQLNPQVLFADVSMAWNRRTNLIKHTRLDSDELPKPGTLVAIDAEFVALQQEEMEFRSDGTKNILRPSHMSLARVSVIRGEGDKEAVPFIDDYIRTTEVVVDYLTEYSGIKNGDLDLNNSPHTLVPLKVAYKKLRLLVDLGCIFIGHGLSKDFRTINIFVPPEQVLDTVVIYTTPGQQRKLSLRFLSWFLLKKDIQTSTHDSIEDARYALLLYRLYQTFEAQGRFEDVMEDIFIEGRKTGFKPPTDKSVSPLPPPQIVPPAGPKSKQHWPQNPAAHKRRW